MTSALIALCVTTLVVVTYAEPPVNIGLGDLGIGDGGYSSGGSLDGSYGAPDGGLSSGGYSSGPGDSSGLVSGGYGDHVNVNTGGEIIATPSTKGVRYAGPIVYTNEKPPVIHFPPPPKPKKGGGYGKGGKVGKGHTIKYVPLPHHDLPVLIYQSDINPPIHVVHPPKGAILEQDSQAYGPPQAEYGPPTQITTGSTGYQPGPPPADFGVQGKVITGGASSITTEYGAPSQNSYVSQALEYGPPQQQAQFSPPKGDFGAPQAQYGPPKGDFGPPQAQYGPPKAQKVSYGPPPKAAYGPPKKGASQPLPHIIYSGHPPIHIFQQPPIYMSAPKAASYGPPPKAAYGQPKSHGSSKAHAHSSHSSHSSQSSHFSHSSSSKAQYGPPKAEYGPPKAEYGPPKGDFGIPKAQNHGPPKGEYGPPKAQYGPPKGDHGTASKSNSHGHHISHHLTQLRDLKTHFRQLYTNHFSASLNKLKHHAQQHHSSSQQQSHGPPQKAKANYIVAPKAWNRPPIIIYQGVRPPVHVYEKPDGGYADAGQASSHIGTIGSPPPVPVGVTHTHTVSPIALESPVPAAPVLLDGQSYSIEHAHVAGTNQAGNPAAQSVDLTYGIARISPEGGQFIDPRYKGQVAQARTIWLPNYGLPAGPQYVAATPQNAVYVSDLTSAGQQQYQLLRRNDVLDQDILSGISALRAEAEQSSDTISSSEQNLRSALESAVAESASTSAQDGTSPMQARIDVLPTFLSTANEKTLNSIPVSYSSVIISSAENRSGEPAAAEALDPTTTTNNESSSKSSS